MAAAISDPMPRNVEASWATTSRPVFSTEVARASRSNGDSERRSMTSIDLPSSAAAAAASRHTLTMGPYAAKVTCSPGRATVALNKGRGAEVALRSVSPFSYTHLRAHETRHDLVCRLL